MLTPRVRASQWHHPLKLRDRFEPAAVIVRACRAAAVGEQRPAGAGVVPARRVACAEPPLDGTAERVTEPDRAQAGRISSNTVRARAQSWNVTAPILVLAFRPKFRSTHAFAAAGRAPR